MKKQISPTVQLSPGSVKHDATTRITAGVQVTNLAPTSGLYNQPAVKSAVDAVVSITADLKAILDAHSTARATLTKARTALDLALGAWDGAWNTLCSTGEQVCATADEANSLALPVLKKAQNQLEKPLGVEFTWVMKKDLARIRVVRAPGMNVVVVQYSPDPITATSWIELDGCGAVHLLPPLPPGTYWAQAASKRAHAKSGWTVPVSLIIK